MASYDEWTAALRQRLASGVARAEAAPPDPRLTATVQRAAAEAAKVSGRMAARRARLAGPDPALATACSLADQTLPRHEQLKELKNKIRELEPQLRQAVSVKSHKEAEYKLITEAISNAAAANERLKTALTELCNKRDEYAAIISEQLQDLQIRDAKANEHATWREQFDTTVSWFNEFLGLQIVPGEEGVNFVFEDPQRPKMQCSVRLKVADGTYNLVQCDLPIRDFEEPVKDLNLTGDLLKFLKVFREKFMASSVNDVPSVPFSPPMMSTVNRPSPDVPSLPFSPPVTSTTTNRTSEDAPTSQSNSRSKNTSRTPAKRRGTGTSPSPGSGRPSTRLEVRRRQEKLNGNLEELTRT